MTERTACQTASHPFADLECAWEGLLERCPGNTLFLTPSWQRLWWDRFGREGDLLLLPVREGTRTVGIAPLQRQGTAITFLGDTDLFDYHDFAVAAAEEDAFYPRLVDQLAAEPWDSVRLTSLPEGSPSLASLPSLARQRGWECLVEQEDVSPGLALPPDWEGYLSLLTKKHRHELRRKLRRLEETGDYAVRTYDTAESVGGHLDAFFGLMRQSREEKSRFLTPEREGFFRSMAVALAAEGVAQLWFMEVGGVEVATALCFDYNGVRLLYNSGFDQDYSNLSVGLLLKARCLGDAIGRGMGYFDFLRGYETYKYHLGGVDRLVYRLTITR